MTDLDLLLARTAPRPASFPVPPCLPPSDADFEAAHGVADLDEQEPERFDGMG